MLMAPPPPSIVLLTGADLWLDDGRTAGAIASQAVALRGSRIVEVGPEAQLVKRYPKASRVELKGGTLLPAFTEGHAHVGGLGIANLEVDLSDLNIGDVIHIDNLQSVIVFLHTGCIHPGGDAIQRHG